MVKHPIQSQWKTVITPWPEGAKGGNGVTQILRELASWEWGPQQELSGGGMQLLPSLLEPRIVQSQSGVSEGGCPHDRDQPSGILNIAEKGRDWIWVEWGQKRTAQIVYN